MRLKYLIRSSQLFYFFSRVCVYLYGLVFFLRSVINVPNRADAILRLGIAVFGIAGSICQKKINLHKMVLSEYFKWYAGLLIISFLSSIYSPSISARGYTENILDILFLGVGFSGSISDKYSIKRFMLCFSICSGILFLFLSSRGLLYIDDRLGRTLTGDNTNSFAMYIMLSMFASIITFYLSEKKIEKIIGISISVIDTYMIMLSGGRKYLIAPVILIATISIMSTSGKKNIIKRLVFFALIIFLILFGWNLMITNPTLYRAIGYRFINLVSIQNRETYILKGLQFFFESPIWGHGENAFSELILPYVGRRAYSHNNYIELLTNYGLIGFIWFYYYFIKQLGLHIKNHKEKNNKYSIISVALMIAMLFLDTGTISYIDSSLLFTFWVVVFNISDYNIDMEMKDKELKSIWRKNKHVYVSSC